MLWMIGRMKNNEPKTENHHMTSSEPATEEEILATVPKLQQNLVSLTPFQLPFSYIKKPAYEIVPIINKIVNSLLESGVFPDSLKLLMFGHLQRKRTLIAILRITGQSQIWHS